MDQVVCFCFRRIDIRRIGQKLNIVHIAACRTPAKNIQLIQGCRYIIAVNVTVGIIHHCRIHRNTDITVGQRFGSDTGIIVQFTGSNKVVDAIIRYIVGTSQSHSNVAVVCQLVIENNTGIIGFIKSDDCTHTGIKCSTTDKVFLTGSNFSCAVSGNIQFLQFGKQCCAAAVVNHIGICISVTVRIHGMTVISTGNDCAIIQASSISKNIAAKPLQ